MRLLISYLIVALVCAISASEMLIKVQAQPPPHSPPSLKFQILLTFDKTEKQVKDNRQDYIDAVNAALWDTGMNAGPDKTTEKGQESALTMGEFKLCILYSAYPDVASVKSALDSATNTAITNLEDIYQFDPHADETNIESVVPPTGGCPTDGLYAQYTLHFPFRESHKHIKDTYVDADLTNEIKNIFSTASNADVTRVGEWNDQGPTEVKFEIRIEPTDTPVYEFGNEIVDRIKGTPWPALTNLNYVADSAECDTEFEPGGPCSAPSPPSPQPPGPPPPVPPPVPPPTPEDTAAFSPPTAVPGNVPPGSNAPIPDGTPFSVPRITQSPGITTVVPPPTPLSQRVYVDITFLGIPPRPANLVQSLQYSRSVELLVESLGVTAGDVSLVAPPPPSTLPGSYILRLEVRNLNSYKPADVDRLILAGNHSAFIEIGATSFKVSNPDTGAAGPVHLFTAPTDGGAEDSAASQPGGAGPNPAGRPTPQPPASRGNTGGNSGGTNPASPQRPPPRIFTTTVSLRSSMTLQEARNREPELKRDIAKACEVHEDNVTITNITEVPISRRQATSTVIEFEVTASTDQYANETWIETTISNATGTGGDLSDYQIDSNTVIIVKTIVISSSEANSPTVVYQENTMALTLVAVVGALLIVVIVVVTVIMVQLITKKKKKKNKPQAVSAKQLEESGSDSQDQLYTSSCSPTTSPTPGVMTSGSTASNMRSFDQAQQQLMMQQMMQQQQQLLALQQQQQQSSNLSSFASNGQSQPQQQENPTTSNPMNQQPSAAVNVDM